MIKDRSLTLEALRVIDEIDRQGSFASAADVLDRVPSALSYTIQKLEDDLGVVLFDRSGHRTKFTAAGRLLLIQGRVLLAAAEKLANDTIGLANGWELSIVVVCEASVPAASIFPLVDRLAEMTTTQLSVATKMLSGAWESLEQGLADIVIGPDCYFHPTSGINSRLLYQLKMVYVARMDHPIHKEIDPFFNNSGVKHRAIIVADTTHDRTMMATDFLHQQSQMWVSSMADQHQAILDGLGVGLLPLCMVERDLTQGYLKEVMPRIRKELNIIMAWRQDVMGKAKTWLLQEIPNLFVNKG